jgi:hypothetical protein
MPLVEHGLVRANFVPPLDTREPRDLTKEQGECQTADVSLSSRPIGPFVPPGMARKAIQIDLTKHRM